MNSASHYSVMFRRLSNKPIIPFWHTVVRYYISYNALLTNRILCLPRSERSYYIHRGIAR
jgi:hypothetical protein